MGGNVFNNTARIKKENIKPTLKELYRQLGKIFPGANKHFSRMKTLGSVGKKDYSGDIDLALPEDALHHIEDWNLDKNLIGQLFTQFKKRARTSPDKLLLKRAILVAIARRIEDSDSEIGVDDKATGGGTLFLVFPQYNEDSHRLGEGVQIDINVGDLDWLTFAYYSASYEGNIKGLHRTQLMLALFTEKGYTFSHNYGVKDRETQEIVAKTPTQSIELLNREYNFDLDQDTLSNYYELIDFIKHNVNQSTLNSILDRYLRILDSTRADIPQDLQQYWIDNQSRLGLTGKFLPNDSNLLKYK